MSASNIQAIAQVRMQKRVPSKSKHISHIYVSEFMFISFGFHVGASSVNVNMNLGD